ncbi:MAG: hypothetical protein KJ697_03320 [Nanoarchaeota archaeon]|nr:hypothetical protein [Nanoarchaeota archaeon]
MIKSFKQYVQLAPIIGKIHYWDLPKEITINLKTKEKMKLKNLLNLYGKDKYIEKKIEAISHAGNKMHISFPLKLRNIDYVKLYALMISEGYFKREFSIHVPEEEFHSIFKNTLKNIFNQNVINAQNLVVSCFKTRATKFIRYLIPIPEYIPRFIVKSKDYSREYLKIAFEAEAYPHYSTPRTGIKRYIKLARSVDISDIAKEVKYEESKRISFGKLKREYPAIIKKIDKRPPVTLLGEYYMLQEHFNIFSVMKPDSLRVNKTEYKRGKISMRWCLYIYSDSLDKFIREINFITKRKKLITAKMKKVKGQKRKFSTVKIMKLVSKNNIFITKDVVKKMKELGYKSPYSFIWKYNKRGIIKKISRGKYKIIYQLK